MVHVAQGQTWPHQRPTLETIFEAPLVKPMRILCADGGKLKNVPPLLSKKKVECAKHQWIHLVEDQPESPQALENFVGNARWHSTWARVYISLTLKSSYKPSMHFTMKCTTTDNGGPPGVLTEGTCSLRQSTNCLWKGGGGEEHFGARKIKIFFLGP